MNSALHTDAAAARCDRRGTASLQLVRRGRQIVLSEAWRAGRGHRAIEVTGRVGSGNIAQLRLQSRAAQQLGKVQEHLWFRDLMHVRPFPPPARAESVYNR